MSFYRRSLFVLLSLLLLLPALASSPAHAEDAIAFGDPALEQAVRDHLEMPAGPITREALGGMTYLDVPSSADIKSLSGLEYAVHLTDLTADGNEISDLRPLANLTELRSLQLSSNPIADVTPLAGLGELTTLYLHNAQVQDVSALTGLTKLEELGLIHDRISDLTPLLAMTSLRKLDVTGNRIDVNAQANQSAIATLKERGVSILGLDYQKIPKPSEVTGKATITGPTLTWTKLFPEETDADYRPYKYAFGNGLYVSAEGYTSKDGLHWTSNPTMRENGVYLWDIVYGKGRYVGVGFTPGNDDTVPVWTSTDGLNWTKATDFKASVSVPHIVFNGVRFVVAGGNNAESFIFTSEDGLKWTTRKSGLGTDLKGLAWGNGTFVALGYQGGKFLVSKDGITWKKVAVPTNIDMWELSFGRGVGGDAFFATNGVGTNLMSKDGVKWTLVKKDANGILWGGFQRIKDRYYIAGTKTVSGQQVNVYRTSKDGFKWTDVKVAGTAADFSLRDAVYDGKQYVAYADSNVYASADGVNWKSAKHVYRVPPYLYRSAIGNGRMVIVGGGSGEDWGYVTIDSKGKVNHDMTNSPDTLFDVIWTGSGFFAVGRNGVMMTSKDGIAWKKTASPAKENLTRIIRANGTYYVTGSNGLIMTSTDLKTWKKQKTNTTAGIDAIAWNGKSFVAGGDWGTVLTSGDGKTWKASSIKDAHGDAAYEFADVAWGNGTFILTATQRYNLYLPYTTFMSADGAKWKLMSLGESTDSYPSLFGVSYIGKTFVATGSEGALFLSSNGKEWSKETIPDEIKLFSAQIFNGKLYAFGLANQVYVADYPAK